MKPALVVAMLAVPVLARADDGVPDAARDDVAEATRDARANDWQGALANANRAVEAAPSWPEGYFVRAGILVHGLSAETAADALASAEPSADDARFAQQLAAPARDLRRYLELAPDAPDRDRVGAAATDLETRANTANELAQRYTQQLVDAAAKQKRDDEEAARLATLRRHNASVRHVGSVLSLVGLAAEAAAIGLAVNGMGRYDDVTKGGYPTGAAIDDDISTGRAEVAGAYASAVGGLVLVFAGIAVIKHHEDPQ